MQSIVGILGEMSVEERRNLEATSQFFYTEKVELLLRENGATGVHRLCYVLQITISSKASQ